MACVSPFQVLFSSWSGALGQGLSFAITWAHQHAEKELLLLGCWKTSTARASKKTEGIFNWLPHREELLVNSLLKFTVHLPLVDRGNSFCPEAVVTVEVGICRQLINSAGEGLDTTASPFHLTRLGHHHPEAALCSASLSCWQVWLLSELVSVR